jgi:hypothetical protein
LLEVRSGHHGEKFVDAGYVQVRAALRRQVVVRRGGAEAGVDGDGQRPPATARNADSDGFPRR